MKNILKRGFTLVELLVVVLIIGILSSVALPQYTKAVKKAKGVKIITTVSALAKAMNMAYLEDGIYRRYYQFYSGYTPYSSDEGFDIEVPAVQIAGEQWDVVAFPGNQMWSSPQSTAFVQAYKQNGDVSLTYRLSDGKISSISCSGSECSSYFPGTILSSN